MKTREQWERDARERGRAAATWVFDGNTPRETVAHVLRGIENGDPEVLHALSDMCPRPLSGEWSGESIPELFGIEIGGEWPSDDILDEYEHVCVQSFYWHVDTNARRILAGLTD